MSVEQVAGLVGEPGQGHSLAARVLVVDGSVDATVYDLSHYAAVAPRENVLKSPKGGRLYRNGDVHGSSPKIQESLDHPVP